MRVLVIEDDSELAEAIGVGLRREQMAVDLASDGDAGLQRALVYSYDVIVLDRDLPRMHGDEVCAHLVERACRSRVIMLTAAATIEDRVEGLRSASLSGSQVRPRGFLHPRSPRPWSPRPRIARTTPGWPTSSEPTSCSSY